ncbi:MAG: pseudouridine synthase [Pseudomonadota bacterium]
MPPRLMMEYLPPKDPLRVIHEDAAVIVISKPSGLLSVPGKPAEHRDCLLDRVVAVFPDALLIHRLDLETSGIVIFARGRVAQKQLNRQFEKRVVEKTYIARVEGRVVGSGGRIELPLTADWPNRPMQKVCFDTGKPSVTDWRVLDREADATRLSLTPHTGRSHQLRVHLRAIGHSILGDPFYASEAGLRAASWLQLHAESLRFRHPDGGDWMCCADPCPF